MRGGFPWRVSRTPARTDLFLDVRVPPTMPMAEAREALGDWVRSLQERFPDFGIDWEIYVTAPGAEIEEGHELVRAIDESHTEVYGAAPERDTVRWFSDASRADALRHPDRELRHVERPARRRAGENLEIRGLVDTAARLRAHRAAGLRVDERRRHELLTLPDLPVPVDDGACAHLEGMAAPALELESSMGPVDLAAFGAERGVLYVYPRTGQPGVRCPRAGTRSPARAAARRSRAGSATTRRSSARLGVQRRRPVGADARGAGRALGAARDPSTR